MLGPDVSSWQPGIDWSAVFASGRHFCFIKTNEGGTFTDPDGAANRARARDAGLVLRGLYDFARLGSPEGQADFYCDDIKALGAGEVAVLDAEVNGLTADWCVRWADRVRARLGAGALTALYCSESYYWDELRGDSRLNARFNFKWIAKYRLDYRLVMSSDPRPSIPGALFWQYTDRASIPGIGSCDESVFDGTDADLAALVGATTPQSPKEDDMTDDQAQKLDAVFAYVQTRAQAEADANRTNDQRFAELNGTLDAVAAELAAGRPVDADALAAKVAAAISIHIDAPAIAASVSKVLGSKLSS